MDKLVEKTQLLYCKWCPKDCKGLTRAEKIGCLASGGFADEFLSDPSIVRIEVGAELPTNPYHKYIDSMEFIGYREAQRDMADWVKKIGVVKC